jgi:hypothetical protein
LFPKRSHAATRRSCPMAPRSSAERAASNSATRVAPGLCSANAQARRAHPDAQVDRQPGPRLSLTMLATAATTVTGCGTSAPTIGAAPEGTERIPPPGAVPSRPADGGGDHDGDSDSGSRRRQPRRRRQAADSAAPIDAGMAVLPAPARRDRRLLACARPLLVCVHRLLRPSLERCPCLTLARSLPPASPRAARPPAWPKARPTRPTRRATDPDRRALLGRPGRPGPRHPRAPWGDRRRRPRPRRRSARHLHALDHARPRAPPPHGRRPSPRPLGREHGAHAPRPISAEASPSSGARG